MAKKDKKAYVVGDIGEDGFEIKNIIGSSPYFMVYFNEKDELRWELDDEFMPQHFSDSIAQFDVNQSMITNALPNSKKKISLLESLGRAFYLSVLAEKKGESIDKFKEIRARIENEVTLYSRRHYVSASLIVTAIICIAFATLNIFGKLNLLLPYWLGAGTGAVGSTLSILLRSSALEIRPFSTPFEHFFQGILRVILGLLAGLIVVILVNADFLLVFAKNNLEAIMVFSMFAGFSERYLPNTLFDFEKSSKFSTESTRSQVN